MSRYIATRAIRGANLITQEAEALLNKALAECGPETPVAFPNTAYYLPTILGMTGREVTKLGELAPVLEHAKDLLHPVPTANCWTPYLGETLDSGMATLLSAEIIEAVRFVYGEEPGTLEGYKSSGASFTSPDGGTAAAANNRLNGPIDDIQLRAWGIQLVDGRMPGFAAIVGAAKSNEVAVKIVRELQKRNILIFLCGNTNGRSMIQQLQEEGVEMGYDTYIVPFGNDTLSAIYPIGFATRSALTFGGMKGGQAKDILLYNRQRVFAFVLALGEVDDLKYAAAAGAINYGFPVIADTKIPQILPTGVTTYEHVISVPFNEIEGKDDLERAEKLVQKCIETRGVKIKMTEVPIPVPYGSAFEGEVVRKKDMRVEFGGKYSRAFEFLRMVDMDQVEDGKILENFRYAVALCFAPGLISSLLAIGAYWYSELRGTPTEAAPLQDQRRDVAPDDSLSARAEYEDIERRAADYKRRIILAVRERKAGPLKDALRPVLDKIDAWEARVRQLTGWLAAFDEDDATQRDLRETPAAMARLQAEMAQESDPDVRAQMNETLAGYQAQQAHLDELQSAARQTRLQLDEALSAMGLIYSQLQLLAVKELDNASARRISEGIQEQTDRLDDLLSSVAEVYSMEDGQAQDSGASDVERNSSRRSRLGAAGG